jgi:hypothetical protein
MGQYHQEQPVPAPAIEVGRTVLEEFRMRVVGKFALHSRYFGDLGVVVCHLCHFSIAAHVSPLETLIK